VHPAQHSTARLCDRRTQQHPLACSGSQKWRGGRRQHISNILGDLIGPRNNRRSNRWRTHSHALCLTQAAWETRVMLSDQQLKPRSPPPGFSWLSQSTSTAAGLSSRACFQPTSLTIRRCCSAVQASLVCQTWRTILLQSPVRSLAV
jgi:hypothetical protein